MANVDIENINWSDSEDSKDEFGKSIEIRCAYCYKILSSSSQIPIHEKTCELACNCTSRKVTCKDGSQKFICDICCRTYKYANSLAEHEKRHLSPGGFRCKYCKSRYCTEVQLEQHTEEDHKIYKCQICKETFDTADIYVEHIKMIHNGQDKLYHVCEECGRQFSSLHILKFHIDTKCGTLRLYKCDKCDKTFKTKYLLKAHDLLHLEGKQYCCSFCGNKFATKAALQRHERRHTGEKPFKCEICGKSFAYGESLVTHSSVHTGIKPYLCECCGSRFSCTGNLLAHRRKRLDTCGQPQYCTKLAKACPRPSIKTSEPAKQIVIKVHKVLKDDVANKSIGNKNRRGRKKTKYKIEETKCNVSLIDKDELPSEVIQEIFDAEIPVTKDDLYMAPVIKLEDSDIINYDVINKKNNELNVEILQFNLPELILKNEPMDNFSVSCKSENKSDDEINKVDAEGSLHSFTDNLETPKDFESKEAINSYKKKSKKENYSKENSGDFTCNFCNKTFTILKSFQSHLRLHDNFKNENTNWKEDKKFCLDIKSDKNFNDDNNHNESDDNGEISVKEELNDSSNSFEVDQSHNEDKNMLKDSKIFPKYDCSFCLNKTFSTKSTFIRHLRNIHKKQSTEIWKILLDKKEDSIISSNLQCKYCGKFYSIVKALKKHLKLHGRNGTLIHLCRCCNKYFATPDEVQNHINTKHKEEITCTICNKTYKDAELLQAHKKYSHSDDPNRPKKYTFICNKCGRTFSSRTALTNHELSDCGKSPIHKCNVCNKGLHSAGSLKSHMLIHSGELEFKCKYCEKCFARKGQCQIHERKHTGEKPFPCTYCDKAFAYRENLLIHISTHTGLKRYMCNSCGERFSCVTGLKAHWRTHPTTCGADPKRSTKATGVYLGFQKGQLVHTKEPTESTE